MTDGLHRSLPSGSSRDMGGGAAEHPILTVGRWCDTVLGTWAMTLDVS